MNDFPSVGMVMLIPFLIWLAIIAFVITLALRLVRGVERIAAALERDGPSRLG